MAPSNLNKKKKAVSKVVTRAKYDTSMAGYKGKTNYRKNGGALKEPRVQLDSAAGHGFEKKAVAQYMSASSTTKEEKKFGLGLKMLVGRSSSENQAMVTAGGFVQLSSEVSFFGYNACLEMLSDASEQGSDSSGPVTGSTVGSWWDTKDNGVATLSSGWRLDQAAQEEFDEAVSAISE